MILCGEVKPTLRTMTFDGFLSRLALLVSALGTLMSWAGNISEGSIKNLIHGNNLITSFLPSFHQLIHSRFHQPLIHSSINPPINRSIHSFHQSTHYLFHSFIHPSNIQALTLPFIHPSINHSCINPSIHSFIDPPINRLIPTFVEIFFVDDFSYLLARLLDL